MERVVKYGIFKDMDPFWIRWVLSIIVGGSWVTATTIIAERIGPKLGGLIGGMPSTALVSFLFIALTQSAQAAVAATTVVPMSVGFYCFFFLTYLLLARQGFVKALAISLAVWLVFATLSILINIQSIEASIIIWLILIISSIWYALTQIHLKPVSTVRMQYTPHILLARAALSGIIISMSVLMAKLAGPVWGGVLSTFPALTVSTLLITQKTGGLEFTQHLMKNILISTTINLGIFAILVRVSFAAVGPWFGTLIAYIGMLLVTYILNKTLKK